LIYALKLENPITLQNNNVRNKKQCTSMWAKYNKHA
jgi:hypothetical protein